tara:strand:- start:220 stop:456 length:237 start_codon:yes stop_codon:yes gene_type:complete
MNKKIKKTKGGSKHNNNKNIFDENKELFIILGIVLFILILIGIFVYYICNNDSGSYYPIGKTCMDKIYEFITNTDRTV